MECVWRLLRNRQQDGYCHEQDPSVFYLHIIAHHGFTDHYLYGPCLLAQPAQVYHSGQKKSVVLSVIMISFIE